MYPSAHVGRYHYGDEPVQRRLALYAGDDQQTLRLVNVYDLEIGPRDQAAIVAGDLPLDARIVEAQLDGQDVLALDDRAWAVYRRAEPAAVTLVSEGNLFLETGLALHPGLQVTTVRPASRRTAPSG